MRHPFPCLIPNHLNSAESDHQLSCYSPLNDSLRKFKLPNNIVKRSFCLASCHGWLLLMPDDGELTKASSNVTKKPIICNPITRVHILLPDIRLISVNFFSGAMSTPPTNLGCTILLINGNDIYLHKLNSIHNRWIFIRHTIEGLIFDSYTINCGGKFYIMLSATQKLYVIDPCCGTCQFIDMECSVIGDIVSSEVYEFTPLEINGLVFLVKDFRVFRADFSRKEWVKVDNIGEYVIFLNGNAALSLLASDIGCKENTIYSLNSKGKNMVELRVLDLETRIWAYGSPIIYEEAKHHLSNSGRWFLPILDYVRQA